MGYLSYLTVYIILNKNEKMKKLSIVFVIGAFAACGTGNSDSTTDSTTVVTDTTSVYNDTSRMSDTAGSSAMSADTSKLSMDTAKKSSKY